MATRLTIETAARTELQEATPGFWTATELHQWFDEANAEITVKTKVEAKYTPTLVAGTEDYALPADFYLMRRVELQTTAGSATNWMEVLPYNLDLRRPGDPTNPVTLTGVPSGYYIFGGRIYFVPIPDGAYSGTYFYYKNAVVSTQDTDLPNYPEGLAQVRVDTAIRLYICAMALRKRQDGAFTTYANDFNAAVASMERDAEDRGSMAPLQVHDDWYSENS